MIRPHRSCLLSCPSPQIQHPPPRAERGPITTLPSWRCHEHAPTPSQGDHALGYWYVPRHNPGAGRPRDPYSAAHPRCATPAARRGTYCTARAALCGVSLRSPPSLATLVSLPQQHGLSTYRTRGTVLMSARYARQYSPSVGLRSVQDSRGASLSLVRTPLSRSPPLWMPSEEGSIAYGRGCVRLPRRLPGCVGGCR